MIRVGGTRNILVTCRSLPGKKPVLPDKAFLTYFGDEHPLSLDVRFVPPSLISIRGIPPGYYLLHGEKEGFLPGKLEVIVDPKARPDEKPETLNLWKKVLVPVEVRDSRGRPVCGVRLLCHGKAPEELDHATFRSDPVLTDAQGRAEIGVFPGADLWFNLFKQGYAPAYAVQAALPSKGPLILKLFKGGRIEGRVSPPLPAEKDHACRVLLLEEDSCLGGAPVDEKGRFRFDYVLPGDYTLVLREGGGNPSLADLLKPLGEGPFDGPVKTSVRVKEGAAVKVILQPPSMGPRGTILGRVTLSGSPLPGVKVRILDGAGSGARCCRTNREGEYIFENVPPSTCSVQVLLPLPACPEGEWVVAEKDIDIEKGERLVRNFDLPGGRIEGCVVDPLGKPVPFLRIEATVECETAGDTLYSYFSILTGPDGRFSIHPARPGGWEFTFPREEWIPYKKQVFTLAPGERKALRIRLAQVFPVRLRILRPPGWNGPIKTLKYYPLQGQPYGPYEKNILAYPGFAQVFLPGGEFRVEAWTREKTGPLVWEGNFTARPGLLEPIQVSLSNPWDPLKRFGVTVKGKISPPEVLQGKEGTLEFSPPHPLGEGNNSPFTFETKVGPLGRFSLRLLPGYYDVTLKRNGAKVDSWFKHIWPEGTKNLVLRIR